MVLKGSALSLSGDHDDDDDDDDDEDGDDDVYDDVDDDDKEAVNSARWHGLKGLGPELVR